MPPKKKGGRKGGNDDWEAELGESIAPVNAASPNDANANNEDPAAGGGGGGGLMGLMRKTKEKRKKKGLSEDWIDEATAAADGDAQQPASEPVPDLSAKAAQEANLEDEFALPEKKTKGGKGKQQQQQQKAAPEKEEVADGQEPIRVLTKAEKERLKKEREKQRKKEQVDATT